MNKGCLESVQKITRTDIHSFTLLDLPIIHFFIILIIILGLLISIAIFVFSYILSIIVFLFNLIFVLIIGFKTTSKQYLSLKDNTIVLSQKTLFTSKSIVYRAGELERAEISYTYEDTNEGDRYDYNFYFVKKTGEREVFYSISTPNKDEDLKGVKYFIDLLNQYIQQNMN